MTTEATNTPQTHWEALHQSLLTLPERPDEWRARDIEMLMEVEAVLYLYVNLTPDSAARSARDAWTLVSGYLIMGLNDSEVARQRCLRLRAQLRYVRTYSAWKRWLRWYEEQPEELRFYGFETLPDNTLHVTPKFHDVILYGERVAAYEERCTITPSGAATVKITPFASAGHYEFSVNDSRWAVDINEVMAAQAQVQPPQQAIALRSTREAITITFDALKAVAHELDQREEALNLTRRGNWVNRLSKLRLKMFKDDTLQDSDAFTINEVFHLVGKLGVGKSTLIWLITYWLTTKHDMHVTVVMNTVVETVRMAEWLVMMGIRAVPALGRDRKAHTTKYAAVTTNMLHSEIVFAPEYTPSPVFDWMPKPCALSAAVPDGIPPGQEPCNNLQDEKGNPYRCPLFHVCPVYQIKRDLVNAQVWLVNPKSLLYSAAPEGLGDKPLRLLEAVYQHSDLVIIDEADRVQAQWDDTFAPTLPIAGSENSLLDQLHVQLSQASVGTGRRRAASASFNRLTKLDNQADTLANHLFRLIEKNRDLATWIKQSQLTNRVLYSRLVKGLLGTLPRNADKEAHKEKLTTIFNYHWQRKRRHASGDEAMQEARKLHAWIDMLLASPDTERRLQKQLSQWLIGQMGWKGDLNKDQNLLVAKLAFCLTMTALLKRVNDILYLLPSVEDAKITENRALRLRDEIVRLVPDPPIGAALGVRHVRYEANKSAGIFELLDYQGVGRWLMSHFSTLYYETHGIKGPHVLLTSATSWLPGAASFNVLPRPHGLLLTSSDTQPQIHIEHRKIKSDSGTIELNVSGAGDRRQGNLQQIVQKLAAGNRNTPSLLQQELDHWDQRRRVLLVVNSYEQVNLVFDQLQRDPDWQGRVYKVFPDREEHIEENAIRAGQSEAFRDHDADVLIAPLQTIQRGLNILDDEDAALLGSAFFLVRPYPPPEDLTPQLLSLNQWTLNQLEENTRILKPSYSQHGIRGLAEMRKDAYRAWHTRINSGHWGVASLHEDAYAELLRDQFITIWQAIGRLLRGERNARVFFVDKAFSSSEGRHTLHDWHNLLENLLKTPVAQDQSLASGLYQPAYDAFARAYDRQELE